MKVFLNPWVCISVAVMEPGTVLLHNNGVGIILCGIDKGIEPSLPQWHVYISEIAPIKIFNYQIES